MNLLWLSWTFALPGFYFEFVRSPSRRVAIFMVVAGAVVLALAALLITKVSSGRNWARWVLLAVVVAALASEFLLDDSGRVVTVIESALDVLSYVVDGMALYLLFFSPAALYFRSK